MMKIKCPNKRKKRPARQGWTMTSEDKQRRGATVPLSSGESPFLPSSAEHDLFLCTCQGSYTHKEFWIRARKIPLYSFRLNHNSGSNSPPCDKYFFFWHSRNQFEFLCSVHANIPSFPSPPKKNSH